MAGKDGRNGEKGEKGESGIQHTEQPNILIGLSKFVQIFQCSNVELFLQTVRRSRSVWLVINNQPVVVYRSTLARRLRPSEGRAGGARDDGRPG